MSAHGAPTSGVVTRGGWWVCRNRPEHYIFDSAQGTRGQQVASDVLDSCALRR
jgi:hypothetical protein